MGFLISGFHYLKWDDWLLASLLLLYQGGEVKIEQFYACVESCTMNQKIQDYS